MPPGIDLWVSSYRESDEDGEYAWNDENTTAHAVEAAKDMNFSLHRQSRAQTVSLPVKSKGP